MFADRAYDACAEVIAFLIAYKSRAMIRLLYKSCAMIRLVYKSCVMNEGVKVYLYQ